MGDNVNRAIVQKSGDLGISKVQYVHDRWRDLGLFSGGIIRWLQTFVTLDAPVLESYMSRNAAGSLTVRWGAVDDADEYKVYRSTSSGSGFALVDTVAGLIHTSTALSNNTQYFYKVRASNASGDSEDSNEVSGYTAILYDTFNRANNTSVVGNADTGQTWATWVGTAGINGNAWYPNVASGAAGGSRIASGISSFVAGMELSDAGSVLNDHIQALIFRYVDASNRVNALWGDGAGPILGTAKFALQKVVAGAATTLASNTTDVHVKGDVVEADIRTAGTIKMLHNGVERYSISDSTHTSATSHGCFAYNESTNLGNSRIDNFRVYR